MIKSYKEKINVHDHTWHLIINPNICNGTGEKKSPKISKLLIDNDIEHKIYLPDTCEHGRELAKQLSQQGVCHFMVMGGDGTLNEMLNGIFTAEVDTTQRYVVLIPSGTGNDWARTHGYSKQWKKTIQGLKAGYFMRHDVGKVVSNDENGKESQRYFINIAGFGFDAAVIQHSIGTKPKILSSAVYIVNLLKVLFLHKAQLTKVKFNGKVIQENIFSIAVGICRYNGKGMKQVPKADPCDGFFDLVLIRKIAPLKVLVNAPRLFWGTHTKLREVSIDRTHEIEITTHPYLLGEVEGEMLTSGSYKITLLPQALNTLVVLSRRQKRKIKKEV